MGLMNDITDIELTGGGISHIGEVGGGSECLVKTHSLQTLGNAAAPVKAELRQGCYHLLLLTAIIKREKLFAGESLNIIRKACVFIRQQSHKGIAAALVGLHKTHGIFITDVGRLCNVHHFALLLLAVGGMEDRAGDSVFVKGYAPLSVKGDSIQQHRHLVSFKTILDPVDHALGLVLDPAVELIHSSVIEGLEEAVCIEALLAKLGVGLFQRYLIAVLDPYGVGYVKFHGLFGLGLCYQTGKAGVDILKLHALAHDLLELCKGITARAVGGKSKSQHDRLR